MVLALGLLRHDSSQNAAIWVLTSAVSGGIIPLSPLPLLELLMSDQDRKLAALRTTRTLNPHPEAVHDPAFIRGDPFFDAHDLLQVKYEMLRRVLLDGQPVTTTAAAFGFSRPSFYAALAAWQAGGLVALLPERPGPRTAHKLTPQIVSFLLEYQAQHPQVRSAELVQLLNDRFGLLVHPRSVERALARQRKNR